MSGVAFAGGAFSAARVAEEREARTTMVARAFIRPPNQMNECIGTDIMNRFGVVDDT